VINPLYPLVRLSRKRLLPSVAAVLDAPKGGRVKSVALSLREDCGALGLFSGKLQPFACFCENSGADIGREGFGSFRSLLIEEIPLLGTLSGPSFMSPLTSSSSPQSIGVELQISSSRL
jgi:hypothetical protein